MICTSSDFDHERASPADGLLDMHCMRMILFYFSVAPNFAVRVPERQQTVKEDTVPAELS